MRIIIALVAIVATTGILGAHVPPPQASAQTGLFSDTTRQPSPRTAQAGDHIVVRARYVEVNLGLIDGTPRAPGSRGGAGETLTLNLFPNQAALFPEVTLTAVRTQIEASPLANGFIWSGQVAGDPNSQVTLVVGNGMMAGNIRTQGRWYQVRYAGSGVHLITEVNPRGFPDPEDPLEGPPSASAAPSGGAAPRATAVDDGSLIDVLVVYTPATAAAAQGNIEGNIALAASEANRAYTNSLVNFRIRIVRAQAVVYTESSTLPTSGENLEQDLYRLAYSGDGVMEECMRSGTTSVPIS